MSEKYDKFQQVRLLPAVVKRLKRASEKDMFHPSLASMVNSIVQDWLDKRSVNASEQAAAAAEHRMDAHNDR